MTDKVAQMLVPSFICVYLVYVLTVQLHNLDENGEKGARKESTDDQVLKQGKLGGQDQSHLLSNISKIFLGLKVYGLSAKSRLHAKRLSLKTH